MLITGTVHFLPCIREVHMPTKRSQFILSAIRSNRALFDSLSGRMMRIDAPAERVAGLPMLGTTGKLKNVGDIPAILVSPGCLMDEKTIILHMHGGAYVSGGLLQARVLASHIAAATCLNVMTFAYRLAPEYPYPAQLNDAMAVYNYLLSQGYAPENIAFTGESAGGNLAMALSLKLKAEGRPMPACIALLSPWGDVEMTGDSYRDLKGIDPTLDLDTIREAALGFVGGDRSLMKDPLVSPIYADFHGFPPVQIHVGTKELLLSDAEKLAAAMQRDDVSATLMCWEGMCHVFQVFGFQESRLSMKAIGQFLNEHLPVYEPSEDAL
jgi:acetyl esterase/lipase